MYRLNIALRIVLVICTLAFTATAQGSGVTMVGGRDGTAAGTGTALGGGGIIGGEKGSMSTMSQGTPGFVSGITGGSQPHTNASTDSGLSFIILLLTSGMSLTGF